LSRALGDFEFKKNYALGPQKQVITADPDVTVHDVTDEDEFLVLACDGKSASSKYDVILIFSQVSGIVYLHKPSLTSSGSKSQRAWNSRRSER
jgi:hypothetical protein